MSLTEEQREAFADLGRKILEEELRPRPSITQRIFDAAKRNTMPPLDLNHIFQYHPPNGPAQVEAYKNLRDAAKMFATIIVDLCPEGADQSAALRKVREAVMTANAGIALGGRLHRE